jgi:hypothetical protein
VKARLVLLAAIVALALAGCGRPGFAPGVRPLPVKLGVPPPPLATATASYLGVYEPGVPQSYQPVTQFAALAGRAPNLALYYSGARQPFAAAFARKARAHGAIPLIQMQPFGISMAGIAAGRLDWYLRSYADSVRDYGHPVVISFAHEMNGSWYPWGYGHVSPATWVAAWRHVVTVFRGQGAANVTWLWVVNWTATDNPPLRSWWPGSSYVTWVGIDGYLTAPQNTFRTVFTPTVTDIRAFSSAPVLIGGQDSGPVRGRRGRSPARPGLVRRPSEQRCLPPGLAARGRSGGPGRVPPRGGGAAPEPAVARRFSTDAS